MISVVPRDGSLESVDRSLRLLKRLNQKNGNTREWRQRRAYCKKSEERKRKKAEAKKRLQKNLHRRRLREGY